MARKTLSQAPRAIARRLRQLPSDNLDRNGERVYGAFGNLATAPYVRRATGTSLEHEGIVGYERVRDYFGTDVAYGPLLYVG